MKQNRYGVFALMFLLFMPGASLMAAGDGINTTELIARFVNFIVFFGGLGYILKAPVVEFFRKRVEDIRTNLEKAETSQKEARDELDRIEDKMKRLDAEVEVLDEFKAQAEVPPPMNFGDYFSSRLAANYDYT